MRFRGPEHWVGRIAPRSVIAVNATDDDSLPRSSIEALHRALGESSEVIWVPGGHVKPRRAETVQAIADLILTRLAMESEGEEKVAPRQGAIRRAPRRSTGRRGPAKVNGPPALQVPSSEVLMAGSTPAPRGADSH